MASESELYSLVKDKEFAAALELLNGCDDDKAREQLAYSTDGANALMWASFHGEAPEELIRAMVKRAPRSYINILDSSWPSGKTAAIIAAEMTHAAIHTRSSYCSHSELIREGAVEELNGGRTKPASPSSIALSSALPLLAVSVITMIFIRNRLSPSILTSQLSLTLLKSSTIFTASMANRMISLA
jgi:hypothetical protein